MTARDAFKATLVVLATLVAAYVLFLNREIIIVLLFAIIIASAVRPIVMRLTRWRVPEALAVLLVYVSYCRRAICAAGVGDTASHHAAQSLSAK